MKRGWRSSGGANAGSGRVLSDRAASGRWTDFWPRLLSTLVLAPAALLCVWSGGLAWVVLLLAGAVLLAAEWSRLSHGRPWMRLAGVGYLGAPIACLAWLRTGPHPFGLGNVVLVLVLVWGSDIVAYGVGRVVGGPRLAPAISPGKTWSGAAGGLCGAALVMEAAARWTGGPPGWALLLGLGLGTVSQAGDLFESWIKRRVGVKDSGTLIPGHGGLLDRVDALLAVAPAAALLAAWAGRGTYLWR